MLNIRILLTLTVTLFIFGDHMSVDGFIRVCYFQSWQRYKTTYARYYVGDIDPSICTHLVYAFGKLDRTLKQVVAAEAWMEEGPNNNFWNFNNFKQSNPSLKTLLSIGGQNDHSDGFVTISATDEILQNFVRTTISFLRERNFDGLDIDWEFPDATTKDTHVKLLKALREGFDNETADPSKRLLLTIAGAAGQWFIDPGYNVPEVAKYIDFANLMTYDYTASDSLVTAFNSPLYSRSDPRFNPTLSTNWTVHYWNQKGLPFSKIVVGVTGVGRRLVMNMTLLANNPNALIGAATTGEVRTAPDYQFPAGLAYPEICEWLKNSSVKSYFDDEQKNPYLVQDDNWVGYEDERSIEIKVKWMADLGVAGLMFWALDQDDFTGQHCGKGKYPLLNAVIKSAPTTTSTSTTTTTTTSTTTKAPAATTKAPATTTTKAPATTTKAPATTTKNASATTTTKAPTTTTKKATPQTEKPSTDESKSSNSDGDDAATSLHSPSMVVAILMASIAVLLTLF